MAEAIEQGQISGDGRFTQRCHVLLEQALHARKVLLTMSCTLALEMTALLLGIQPGDEVIVPSFTDDLSLHLGLRLGTGSTATGSTAR